MDGKVVRVGLAQAVAVGGPMRHIGMVPGTEGLSGLGQGFGL